jgi:predicted Rossmann fold nucleotide-binding protein DprA/Smf involved in DNA uptake
LVEQFGSAEAVFRASLTELESTGIQTVSAQSLATGKSAELAREEIAHAAAADVALLSMDDLYYPPRLKEIYDPPLILRVRGNPEVLTEPGSGGDLGRRVGRSPDTSTTYLDSPASPESQDGSSASLFPDEGLPPHEKRILTLLKADEATPVDEIVERLQNDLSSTEILAALFELELAGKVGQMLGKNFVTSQIRRAPASIGANIAEGCGRRSDSEMRRFVQIARGSANELEYHLLLARDLQRLTAEESNV